MTEKEYDAENKVASVMVSSHPKFNDLLFSDDIWTKLNLPPETSIQVRFWSRYGLYEFARHPKPITKPEKKPFPNFEAFKRCKGKFQNYSFDFEPFSWLPLSERPAAAKKAWEERFERHKELGERAKKKKR